MVLESPTVFVLVTDNKFDFYNITEIADKKYRILDRALKHIIVKGFSQFINWHTF